MLAVSLGGVIDPAVVCQLHTCADSTSAACSSPQSVANSTFSPASHGMLFMDAAQLLASARKARTAYADTPPDSNAAAAEHGVAPHRHPVTLMAACSLSSGAAAHSSSNDATTGVAWTAPARLELRQQHEAAACPDASQQLHSWQLIMPTTAPTLSGQDAAHDDFRGDRHGGGVHVVPIALELQRPPAAAAQALNSTGIDEDSRSCAAASARGSISAGGMPLWLSRAGLLVLVGALCVVPAVMQRAAPAARGD
jgi:hypothetical protein